MADVIVTGSGIWSRASDVDFEEALAAEDEEDRLAAAADNSTTDHSKQGGAKSSTHHGNGSLVNIQAGTSFDSEESGYAASASAGSVERFRSFKSTHSRKKRIGRGNPLLATSLQEWNSYVRFALSFRTASAHALSFR